MNTDLKCFANWALNSHLTVNVDKIKYMICYSSNRSLDKDSRQIDISYNGKKLQRVNKYSYLGFLLDEKTNGESHVNLPISKTYNKIYMLGKLRKYIDPRTAVQIFKSYVLPHLEYCDYLLIGTKKTTLEKLQKAVNHSLRICFNAPKGTSNFKLHALAILLPLTYRRDITY